ncbi:hypothetical protein J113_11955 [Mycobacterium tuberculosis CAS/NITR204]|uniref:Cyclase n=2 Tax=Mycobacterium tuberculosis TaxID=1773 RepID=R4MGU4_MYCTX|nr:hypothetical protein J113_11955 [Mycobacterium tuberculosis CAS/NITR204]
MTFAWPLGAAESTLEFYDLSHPWGHGAPAWPYFEDVQIERLHGMAKSRVLTQKITTVMHSGTHIDAPAHVVEGTPFLDEIPLSAFFGTGVVVSIPKGKWGMVTAEDLQNATPDIRPGDIVVVNTGWHHKYADSAEYYAYSPGFDKKAGEWFAAKGVKAVGTDTQALDHPLATAIAPHGPAEAQGGLLPWAVREYEAQTGRKVLDDFPDWEPCHRAILSQGIYGFENVGGDLDKVTGKRVTFAAFPWRWVGGDGCIVRWWRSSTPPGLIASRPERRSDETDTSVAGPQVCGAGASRGVHHAVAGPRGGAHRAILGGAVGLSARRDGRAGADPGGDRLRRARRRAGGHRRRRRNRVGLARQRAPRQRRTAIDTQPHGSSGAAAGDRRAPGCRGGVMSCTGDDAERSDAEERCE